MKGNHKVTDEKIELILRLRKDDKNEREIAKAVQLSQGTVNRILNQKYIHVEQQKPKPTDGVFNWSDYENSIIL